MAQDMVVLGNGFCKIGWKHQIEETPRSVEDVQRDMQGVMSAEVGLAASEGRPMEEVSKLVDFVALTDKRVAADEPYVEYVSPYDLFLPHNARRIEETRWIAQRIVLPIDEIKANKTLKNTDQVIADGLIDNKEMENWRSDGSALEPMIYETATIYEFYDMRTRTLTVLQLGMNEPLYRGDIPYSHRHAPFIHMRNFSDGGNEVWSFGDLENIASLQEKLNETFTEQVDNMRRAGNKYVTIKGLFDADSRDRLESDEPDVVVEMEPINGIMPRDAITALQRAPLPADIYGAQGKFEDAIRQVLGINDFQAGGVGADRMSAYAAAVVDGVATLRAKDKQQSVEKAASGIFNQMIRLCQEFLIEGRVIRLLGQNGGIWSDIDNEVLVGEFDMRVEGGSLSAVNPATKQARAIEMLSIVVPALTSFGYDPEPAMRHIVRDLGYDPDQFLKKMSQVPELAAPAAPAGAPAEADLAALLGQAPAPAPEALPMGAEQLPPELLAALGTEQVPPTAGEAIL
jgi:hypothetical protein